MGERAGPIWLASIAVVVVVGVMGVMSLDRDRRELRDTDGYMRTVRVEELVKGERSWGDPVVSRANAPFGHESHWTIPMDAVLVGTSTVLEAFVDTDEAVYWASVVVSPMLQLALLIVVARAAAPLVGPVGAPVAGLVAAVQPTILSYFGAGRSDHHSLIGLAAAVVLGVVIRLETDPRRWWALAGGVAAGIGLWTSPEFLFPVMLAGLWGVWVWWAGRRSAPFHRDLWLTAAGATWVSLLVERGLDGVGAIEYDRISIVHAVLVTAAAGWWVLVWLVPRPRIVGLSAGVAVGAFLLVVFPGLVSGPFGDVSEELRAAWLDRVSELGPLFRGGVTPDDVVVLVWPVAALPLGWWLRRRSGGVGADVWAALTGWVAVGVVASVVSARFSIYPQLGAGVVMGGLFASVDMRLRSVVWRPIVLGVVAFGWVAVIPVAGWFAADPSSGTGRACDIPAAARLVDDRLASNDIVLAGVDAGPELLYRTNASVIGTPYHRNPGILWTFDVFQADAEEAMDDIRARGVDLILVCPGVDGKDYPDAGEGSLFERLRDDDPPRGLVAAGEAGGFLAFSVGGA